MRQDTAQGQDRIADAVRTAAQRRSRLDAFEVLTNRRTAGLLERLQQLLGDAGRTGPAGQRPGDQDRADQRPARL